MTLMFKVKVLNLVSGSFNTIQEGTRLTHVNQQKTPSKGKYSLERQIAATHTKRQKKLISHMEKMISPLFIVLCIIFTDFFPFEEYKVKKVKFFLG